MHVQYLQLESTGTSTVGSGRGDVSVVGIAVTGGVGEAGV